MLDFITASTYSSTLAMSEPVTFTVTVTLPDTVAPADGDVIATVGPLPGAGPGGGGLAARATAFAALTLPVPKFISHPAVPRSSVDCFTTCWI